ASPARWLLPASGPDSMFSCACGPAPVWARRLGCVSAPVLAAGAGGGCQAGMTVVDSCWAGGAMIVRSAIGMGGAGGAGGGAIGGGGAGAAGGGGGLHDGAGGADADPVHGRGGGGAAGPPARTGPGGEAAGSALLGGCQGAARRLEVVEAVRLGVAAEEAALTRVAAEAARPVGWAIAEFPARPSLETALLSGDARPTSMSMCRRVSRPAAHPRKARVGPSPTSAAHPERARGPADPSSGWRRAAAGAAPGRLSRQPTPDVARSLAEPRSAR